jgi:quercetin dioxygenase-like cupin family protein
MVVATHDRAWSRRGDVEEIVLEDLGSRRTALVRLSAGGVLECVNASGAVDVLVIAGDDMGTYLHRPASARVLATRTGCTVFVKERPSAHAGHERLELAQVAFEPTYPGVKRAVLYRDPDGLAALLDFAPGSSIGPHSHVRGEELFVLRGELVDELGHYPVGTWVRQPPASVHAVQAPNGCRMLTFAHHLGEGFER